MNTCETPMLEPILRNAKIHIDSRLAGVHPNILAQMMNNQPQPVFFYFERGKTQFFIQYHRATPWAGFLNVRLNPVEIYKLSQAIIGRPPFILVDTDFVNFGCSIHDLQFLRNVYNGPIVARDFYMTTTQVDEARACGADGMIFNLALSPTVNMKALHKHCKHLQMKSFYQVSSEYDLPQVPEDEAIVFVSCIDLRQDGQPSLQRALSLASRLGEDRCFIIDTPNNIDEIALASVKNGLLGIAYPSGLWSGENVYRKMDLLKNHRTKDLQEQFELDSIEQQNPYMLSIELHQRPNPIQVIYNSRGEAEKARSIVNQAWAKAPKGMIPPSDNTWSEDKNGIVNLPPGANHNEESFLPSDIARVSLLPVHPIG